MTCQDIINQVEWDLLGNFLGIDQIAEKNGISANEVIAIYMAMEEE